MMTPPTNPFIKWITPQQATGELAEVYGEWAARNPQRSDVADILKCFSHRPDFLRDVIEFSGRVHFSDGHLNRRQKEQLATYVSALNQCHY